MSVDFEVPRWDSNCRRLYLGDIVIKQFRRKAPVAEAILCAFEEEGWKSRVDDPLPPLTDRREPDRLRNEVQALNRRLDKRLIHFFMDGTGEGICWEHCTRERLQ